MTGVPNKRTIYFLHLSIHLARKYFVFWPRSKKWIIFSIDFLINWKSWVCTFIRYFYGIKFGFFKKNTFAQLHSCSLFPFQHTVENWKIQGKSLSIFDFWAALEGIWERRNYGKMHFAKSFCCLSLSCYCKVSFDVLCSFFKS